MASGYVFRVYKYLIYSFTIFFFFTSCYNSTSEQKNIFHYNEYSGIASLDPAFAKNQSIMWAVHQVYNTLVEVDSQLHIEPSLARRWEVTGDKRTYTFYLRND